MADVLSQIGIVNIGEVKIDFTFKSYKPLLKTIDKYFQEKYWNERYGGALSYIEMQKVYYKLEDKAYYQNYFPNIVLPYSLEMIFFKKKGFDKYYVEYDSLEAIFDDTHDAIINPMHGRTFSFYTYDFLDIVDMSFRKSKRRWDKDVNRKLLRVGRIRFDKIGAVIEFGETDYNSQVFTNLSMDLPRTFKDNKTLRTETVSNGMPPPLYSKDEKIRLANNLGICMILVLKDSILVPLRSSDVAVFPNEWGCSISFAAGGEKFSKFYERYRNKEKFKFKKIVDELLTEHLGWELNIEKSLIKSIQPLALMREWFRGGKPQLFLMAYSDLRKDEIRRRLPYALHEKEIKKKGKLLKILREHILMDNDNKDHFPPSFEFMMNYTLIRDFLNY